MSLTTYHNFALILTRAGERTKAIVVDAPAREANGVFDLRFSFDVEPGIMQIIGRLCDTLSSSD